MYNKRDFSVALRYNAYFFAAEHDEPCCNSDMSLHRDLRRREICATVKDEREFRVKMDHRAAVAAAHFVHLLRECVADVAKVAFQ